MRGNIRFLPIEKVLLKDSLGGVLGGLSLGSLQLFIFSKDQHWFENLWNTDLELRSSEHDVAG